MKAQQLDQFTLDIEFLLISVVQGVALAALGSSAVNPIVQLRFEYWLYIISAFLIIIVFWSQAVIHALSFISWPLDLLHNFLYFLVSFIEVVAFSAMMNPGRWFAFNTALFIVVAIVYIVDLRLMHERKSDFVDTPARKRLFSHIIGQQWLELKTVVPLGLLYNVVALYLIYTNPGLFLSQRYHIILVGLQVAFEIAVLTVSLISFKKRSLLISQADVG